MNPLPESKIELSAFDKSTTVFYVESSYHLELNQFIQDNYSQIVTLYGSKNINFCYLPFLLQTAAYWETINYNRPYLSTSVQQLEVQKIYNHLISKQDIEINNGGVLLNAKIGYSNKIAAASIDEKVIDFRLFENLLDRTINYIAAVSNNMPCFQIVSPKNESSDDDFDDEMMSFDVNEQNIDYKSVPQYKLVNTYDSSFELETFQLAQEIRDRIKLLSEYGSLELIGDIIEELQKATQKVSPLFITNDYRIFLKDYGMKEVLMAPLSKCLFFLFLNHPEGILFKELSDYQDELLSIYRNVTMRENIDAAIESIKAMTDPLNNSVNEKCSRIRSAFLELITDELAKNYYITGYRGESKKIELDRSLVEYQQ